MKSIGSRVRAASGVTLLVVGALAAGTGVVTAQPQYPGHPQFPWPPSEPSAYSLLPIPTPDADPWYLDPPNLAALQPGSIIRTRDVGLNLIGVSTPTYARQLLFRSTNVHGDPIATATTVIVPVTAWISGARPVISFQEAIDSTAQACNPSHTLRVGTFKESMRLQYWLAQGFAINIPDFNGKYNTFNTFDEGYMVLDSLRAVKRDESLQLHRSTFGLYGFSGGGSGTTRAAEMRATYAPDVQIAGAAFGGTPGSLTAIAEYATVAQPGLGGLSTFTMWLGAAGLGRQFPSEFDPKTLLNDEGQAILADVQNRCVYTQVVQGAFRPLSHYYRPGSKGLREPGIQRVLESQSLGRHIPDIPLLWWNGVSDELVPGSTALPVVDKYWDAGADLRYFTVPTTEHVLNSAAGWGPASGWLSAVVRGQSPGPKFKSEHPEPWPAGVPSN